MAPSTRHGPATLLALTLLLLASLLPATALAHPDDGTDGDHEELVERDPSAPLAEQDERSEAIISDGPTGRRTRNLSLVGRGERLLGQATTDVWAHGRHAYIGTFNEPCGTGQNFVPGGAVTLLDDVEAPGIAIFDVRNKTQPSYVGNLPSVEGSRTNDVKVDTLNSGDVLVHSNEACAGGPGGFEIYHVDDPEQPVHRASVRIDELNPISDALLGGVTDVGTHNLWLFTQGDRDYVAAVAEGGFDNFRVYDITDPTAPELAAAWGAEELFDPGVGDLTAFTDDNIDRALAAVLDLIGGGVGASANKFLHDVTVSEDGTRAYLSNWDAGLVLLDVSDLAGAGDVSLPNERVVSVAMDVAHGSLDGEVNSHAAWPSEDGRIVVETEEDFSAWERLAPPSNLTFGEGEPPAPLPGVAVATAAGDELEAHPTGNTATVDADTVTITAGPLAGTAYAAIELDGDQPRFADTGPRTGQAVFIGRACADDPIENAAAFDEGDIAVVRRGVCTFREKNVTADSLGASAVVIANNIEESTPWGGVRVWDYSDPANPRLASTFDTTCSAAATPVPGCDPAGTYSVHNVVVERQGARTYAYVSWYWDGMVVLDVTDPYAPMEVARYVDNSPAFLTANGGNPHDFWGVHKVPNEPWIYGSDRNGGLSVFTLVGKGTLR